MCAPHTAHISPGAIAGRDAAQSTLHTYYYYYYYNYYYDHAGRVPAHLVSQFLARTG